jgi:hypothetical protein
VESCCSSCQWGEMSLNCDHQRAYCSSSRWYMGMESMVEWYWQGKPKNSEKKLVPVPPCPPEIPHGMIRKRNRASAVTRLRLTAWDMARPTAYVGNKPNDHPTYLSLLMTQIAWLFFHLAFKGSFLLSSYDHEYAIISLHCRQSHLNCAM